MGKQAWEENQKKIERFWQELETEVEDLCLDANMLRVYQDGLPCSGPLGERIVRETAAKGSRNYQIVQKLKDRLLEERDLFIARSIDSSLKEGETGLLFIGASHDVVSRIAKDIGLKCLD